MGILSNIFSKLFPASHPAVESPAAPNNPAGAAAASSSAAAPAAAAPMPEVDVEKVLSDMSEKSAEKLNWRTSIVDLMKLLGLDSSITARKALAQELHYSGDMNDSASMNIWLHREVMNKVAANGGKVRADLKD